MLRTPMIIVARKITAEPTVPTPLLIEVGPPQWVTGDSTLLVQGLPSPASLSAGERLAADLWTVPVAALPNLILVVAADAVGRWNLRLRLVGAEGRLLAEARTTIVIEVPAAAPEAVAPTSPRAAGADAPAPAVGVPPPSGAGPLPQVAAALREPDRLGAVAVPAALAATGGDGPSPPSVARARASDRPAPPPRSDDTERLIARGEFHLAAGNIANARQFFLRAAEGGSARGALLLAATYDPYELAGPQILGLQPNTALALSWYLRAQELGAALAAERLRRLTARAP
jgi:hypothetical protein